MSDNKNEHVVMAFFASRDAAEGAAKNLRDWDDVNKEVRLGAIGIIYKQDGEIKTKAPRRVGHGIAVGAVVGVVAAALGPAALLGAAVGGGTLGGVVGAFIKQSVNLDEDVVQEIGDHLDAGKAALVVALDEFEMMPTAEQLAGAGGEVRQFVVPPEPLKQASEIDFEHYLKDFDSISGDVTRVQLMSPGVMS